MAQIEQIRERSDYKTTPRIVEIKKLENGNMIVKYDGEDDYAPNEIEDIDMQALIIWAILNKVN